MLSWKKLLNLLIYSNLWIATAALAMSWQTQLLLMHRFEFSDLTIFIFVATLLLYAIHRIIGFQKLPKNELPVRFSFIRRYQSLHIFIAFLSFFISLFLFFQLSNHLKILLLVPIVLAAGYTLPILPNGRRLRDVLFLKNILIAGVWTWITVVLPVQEKALLQGLPLWLMVLGRFCFIFALSLPFDIRDVKMDRQANVQTIPIKIGIGATKKLAIIMNVITICCAFGNYYMAYYTVGDWLGMSLAVLCSSLFIVIANEEKEDMYYAGLLDGMMVLQFLLIWGF